VRIGLNTHTSECAIRKIRVFLCHDHSSSAGKRMSCRQNARQFFIPGYLTAAHEPPHSWVGSLSDRKAVGDVQGALSA
jgi:hypothetical protein